MSTYYTPSIEEFNVGFEYEEKYHEISSSVANQITDTAEDKWRQRTLDSYMHFSTTEQLVKIGNIRVKHLDNEDIESLGWTFKLKTNQPDCKFYRQEFILNLDIKWHLDFYINTRSLTIHNGESYDGYQSWFDGTIKNKSELKRIMNMVGLY